MAVAAGACWLPPWPPRACAAANAAESAPAITSVTRTGPRVIVVEPLELFVRGRLLRDRREDPGDENAEDIERDHRQRENGLVVRVAARRDDGRNDEDHENGVLELRRQEPRSH